MSEKLLDMKHRECGGIAYKYVDKQYLTSDAITASYFYHIDGSAAEVNELIKCGTCGHSIMFMVMEDGKLEAETVGGHNE